MLRFAWLLLLVLPPCLATADSAAELKPYDAVYSSKLKGFKVRVKRHLQVENDKLTVSIRIRKLWFSLAESSVLEFHDDGRLYPATYSHKRRGTSHDHDKELVFDWAECTVIDLLKPARNPLPVDKPAYDTLGYQAQMRLDLMHDPELQHAEYSVTNGFRNRVYSFYRLSEEVLDTPLGKLNTIKFERAGDDDGRQVFVWVAPDWDYLLVRIDQVKKPGAKAERLLLLRADIAGRPVEAIE